jgi:hypothetical protein
MSLPAHLFVSDCDGHLYDTREPDWSGRPPLRRHYQTRPRHLRTAADVKAALRAGPYAWPGGYPLFFVAADGEALSFNAVRDNLREVLPAMSQPWDRSWRVVNVDINYEDPELCCAHTGERIPSAYGEE